MIFAHTKSHILMSTVFLLRFYKEIFHFIKIRSACYDSTQRGHRTGLMSDTTVTPDSGLVNCSRQLLSTVRTTLSTVRTAAVDCSNDCCRLLPMYIYRQNMMPLWLVFSSFVIATHWYSNTIPIA